MSLISRLGSFAGGGTRATIDASEIDELASLLAHAADVAPEGAEKLLDVESRKVHDEAQRTVRGYPKATGATAASMGRDSDGLNRRIWAGTKQGALLEYGTPTTGGPRPWLTGPAEQASKRILTAMADVGRIW